MNSYFRRMNRLIKNIARAFIIFYTIYAVSPVYSSLSIRHCDFAGNAAENACGELPVGILMINMLVSPFMGDQTADTTDKTDVDFLLLKKNAVTRIQPQVPPLVQTTILPPDEPAHVLSACSRYNTLNHSRHQAPDGYFILDSGLSPPVSLS